MRKLLVTLFALSVYFIPIKAQVNGTVQLGLAGYQGDVHCLDDEAIGLFDGLSGALGVGVHIPFSSVVGFRGELTYFRLKGDESDFQDAGHINRSWNFTNNLFELSGLLDWEILGKRRYKNGIFRRTLTPVIFGGVGVAYTNNKVDWNNLTNKNIVQDKVYDKNAELAVPVGIGLKYYLSEKLALGLETGVRLPVTDYYDGISRGANPNENDMYYFGGVKAFFGLGGKKDMDKDGIVDSKDACPDVAGTKKLNGCPDSDYDGIADADDKCPMLRGAAEFGGCPDTDKDGIADSEDGCPLIAGVAALGGCPDRDGDGIGDHADRCPDEDGYGSKSGCPDSDGDGVIDIYDLCPDVAGKAFRKGCPFADADGDGIKDEEDNCPKLRGPTATNGCPDSDRDGFKNSEDKCPFVKGDAPNGCPNGIVPLPTVTERDVLQSRGGRIISRCNCYDNANPIFNISLDKEPKVLTRLGSNPEFGSLHGLDTWGFFDKLTKAYNHNESDRIFLDNLFRAMGYSGFVDATPDLFIEMDLPFGITGNIGYSKLHKTQYARLNNKSEKDLEAFKIKSRNGCDIHFMKTCGNHFFFCPR